MSIYSDLEVREVPLYIPRRRKEWEALLRRCSLEPVEQLATAGLYDSDDHLCGCASLCVTGKALSLQCVAIDGDCPEHGNMGRLIDYLRPKAAEYAAALGIDGADMLVFTKPEYEQRFRALAFHTVGRAPKAVMLESNRLGLATYLDSLRNMARKGTSAVIVMNANPFTKGHLYLIRQAAAKVDNLYIIPVLDDVEGGFPYPLRRRMMQAATAGMDNVHIATGSRYAVSDATFPSYFIKHITDRTDTHIALDLDVFVRHIAPALNATERFVGSEPVDALTARYNELMAEMLPEAGMKLHVIPRLENTPGNVVSATSVRRLLQHGKVAEAFSMLPLSSVAVIMAEMAVAALVAELDTDPKPGLVTPTSAGAHRDMDYKLMRKGIEALRPYFEDIVNHAASSECRHETLKHLGIEAEKRMMEATGGVNTHRGAIFSMGLMLAAATPLIMNLQLSAPALVEGIQKLAVSFEAPEDTNGSRARKKGGMRTALEMAATGYADLFNSWLPDSWRFDDNPRMRNIRLLARIMSELDDTNVYHRGGAEGLDFVKRSAADLAESFSEQRWSEFCNQCLQLNISAGGAADMLALTLLADSLLSYHKENRNQNIKEKY